MTNNSLKEISLLKKQLKDCIFNKFHTICCVSSVKIKSWWEIYIKKSFWQYSWNMTEIFKIDAKLIIMEDTLTLWE